MLVRLCCFDMAPQAGSEREDVIYLTVLNAGKSDQAVGDFVLCSHMSEGQEREEKASLMILLKVLDPIQKELLWPDYFLEGVPFGESTLSDGSCHILGLHPCKRMLHKLLCPFTDVQ